MPTRSGYIQRSVGMLRERDRYPIEWTRPREGLTKQQTIQRLCGPRTLRLIYPEAIPPNERWTVRVTHAQEKPNEDNVFLVEGELIIGFRRGRAKSIESFRGDFNLQTGVGWVEKAPRESKGN